MLDHLDLDLPDQRSYDWIIMFLCHPNVAESGHKYLVKSPNQRSHPLQARELQAR
jgi:hypothetical protein